MFTEKEFEKFKNRFEKYVIRNENGCWGWSGGCVTRGYGAFRCNITKRQISASRASWIIHFGEIPKGMLVCHRCDNPPCTNPNHLFLGTPKDNIHDMIYKTKEALEERKIMSQLEETMDKEGLYIKNKRLKKWLVDNSHFWIRPK